MALALGGAGWDVVVHYNRSQGPANAVADEIRALGRRAATVKADLSDEDSVAGLISNAAHALAPLTALINNASVFEEDDIQSMSRASWDLHLDTNLRAPVKLIQDFAAKLPDGRDGCVVNMIDQRVRKLTPQFLSYTASKAALWTLTQTLAQALGPRIRVNGIGPGPTLQNKRQDADDFAKQNAATILERGATPEDICAALLYLLEARAVTGQMIAVDGGQHLIWRTPDVDGVKE